MAVDLRAPTVDPAKVDPPRVDPPRVLRAAAGDIRRGDQVAFATGEGGQREEVAGEATAVHYSLEEQTVAVVVANRVHFLSADHAVVIIRGLALR